MTKIHKMTLTLTKLKTKHYNKYKSDSKYKKKLHKEYKVNSGPQLNVPTNVQGLLHFLTGMKKAHSKAHSGGSKSR